MAQSPSTNILLVDDEPKNLLALRAVLEPLNQNLVEAQSGDDALRLVLQHDFSVILLDVQMPGMDGFEAARLIRKRERSRHIPIIFLTGIGHTHEWISQGYLSGAVDYIIKPIVPDFLRAKVEVFVELAIARAHLHEQMAKRAQAAAEIEALNRALEKTNAELREANEDLASFNQTVSHDLRAPLRHIQGYIDILDTTIGANLDESARKQLNIIKESAARMTVLVNALLSISQIGRGPLAAKEADMDALVRETREQLEHDIQDRRIEWSIAPLGVVLGDPDLLRQVWVNLLSNAVKYTRRSDSAYIAIERLENAREVIFRIRDNGVGFDMKYADRLFGAFSRLHSARDFEGTGVGLATVRRIVDRHGGRVWAESKPGEGATFQFALPKAVTQP
jgi:Bacteriophytochrome (light-regulated signal transduction histidine kinase)